MSSIPIAKTIIGEEKIEAGRVAVALPMTYRAPLARYEAGYEAGGCDTAGHRGKRVLEGWQILDSDDPQRGSTYRDDG